MEDALIKLLIVESPAKATTIEKYLGEDFKVLATYGHVRDLLEKEGAVDPDDGFSMRYQVIDRNRKHVDRILKAASRADAIYLATDLDREGEAISWHVAEILRDKGVAADVPTHRVVFSEITPRAIREAIDRPRDLSTELVDAQQARRALDYLVGYNLSPLLWRKIRPGLSAGRVQSPALRLIVEREREREAFVPQEYWTIAAECARDDESFSANLVRWNGDKLGKFGITDGDTAGEVRQKLLEAAGGQLTLHRKTKRESTSKAPPPFITSTLQQDAARALGFTAQRTMRTAQSLYEAGHITYMRTDSVALSNDAVSELRAQVQSQFGGDYLPEKPNRFKTKSKNAQEAHEAIRPTRADLTPQDARGQMGGDEARLYGLVWARAMASQMTPARFDNVRLEFDLGDGATFRATGKVRTFPGFQAAYEERLPGGKQRQDLLLPPLEEGDVVTLEDIKADQHFTQPPGRYTEASLVKALEELGIGRPSTYASIIQTLKNREYVDMDGRSFIPTDTGRVVARFLGNHFEHWVDYDFTAELEDELDEISRGEREWVPLLDDFWQDFISQVKLKQETVSSDEARQKRILGQDPKTGREVSVRLGRYGPFAQLGTRHEEKKPEFASLRQGQNLDTITLEDALELFKLPRDLGETPEGEPLSANIGRYGPYIRYGNKFASLGEDDDPHTVTRERALEVVREKKEFDANRIIQDFGVDDIQVLRGRYGPYITNGKKNARIPKDREPESLTLEECQELIAKAPERGRRRKKKAGKKKASKKATATKTTRKKAGKKKAGKKTSGARAD